MKGEKKLSSSAMLKLADKYYFGDEVERDFEKAFYWYLQAAEKNEHEAISQVCLMYYTGVGTKLDYKKAFEWTERALRDQADFLARYIRAEMFFHGEFVQKNYSEALWLYKYVTKTEVNTAAMFRVAQIYESGGYGVEADKLQARAYYSTSAKYGNVSAMNKLGSLYEEGILVKQNYKAAVDWYTLAAAGGSSFAEERLAKLRNFVDCKRDLEALKNKLLTRSPFLAWQLH